MLCSLACHGLDHLLLIGQIRQLRPGHPFGQTKPDPPFIVQTHFRV